MTKLKVAILEDNPSFLKALEEDLTETKLVEVCVRATNSNEFLEKVNSTNIDALVLDIDLAGDSMNGLSVASHLKLPVLFVSGKTRDFVNGIEDINTNPEIPVEHITKPFTQKKLENILGKFVLQVQAIKKARYVYLDFADSKRNKIDIDTIVCIESEPGTSGRSNNKKIYFTNRTPETLYNFSFNKMEDAGLEQTKFLIPHQSYRFNEAKYIRYTDSHEVEVQVFSSKGKLEVKKIPVSENYRKNIRRLPRK